MSENKRTVWLGRVFNLDVEETILPDGRKTVMEVIRHPGSSGIVPIDGSGSVVLISQFRPAIARTIWEIPAGTMRPGEDPLQCARRELQEECGLTGEKFEKMGEILIAPGYSDERIHLFLARGLTPSKQSLDEDELLTARAVPFDQAMEMVRTGEIPDAMSIIGLQMAQSRIEG
jgi:ADP-ribose pyrophosphatase